MVLCSFSTLPRSSSHAPLTNCPLLVHSLRPLRLPASRSRHAELRRNPRLPRSRRHLHAAPPTLNSRSHRLRPGRLNPRLSDHLHSPPTPPRHPRSSSLAHPTPNILLHVRHDAACLHRAPSHRRSPTRWLRTLRARLDPANIPPLDSAGDACEEFEEGLA